MPQLSDAFHEKLSQMSPEGRKIFFSRRNPAEVAAILEDGRRWKSAKQTPSTLESAAGGATNPFNLGDEVMGFFNSMYSASPPGYETSSKDLGEASRAEDKTLNDAHPWAYGLSKMGTETLAAAVAPAGAGAGAIGGGMGALDAFGRADNKSAVDTVIDTAEGGFTGVLAGLGGEAAAKGLTSVGRGVLNVVKNAGTAVSDEAALAAFESLKPGLRHLRNMGKEWRNKAIEIGRYLLDNDLMKFGDTAENVAGKVRPLVEGEGKEVGAAVDAVDQALGARAQQGSKVVKRAPESEPMSRPGGNTQKLSEDTLKDPAFANTEKRTIEKGTSKLGKQEKIGWEQDAKAAAPEKNPYADKAGRQQAIDEVNAGATVNKFKRAYHDIADSLEQDLLPRYQASGPLAKEKRETVQEAIDALRAKGDKAVSSSQVKNLFKQLIEEKRSYPQDGVNGEIYAAIKKKTDSLAEEFGPELGNKFKKTNKDFHLLKSADTLAKEVELRNAANNKISLTDWIVGAGAMSGNPVSLGAAGALLTKRLLRTRGAPTAAVIMDSLGKAMQRASESQKIMLQRLIENPNSLGKFGQRLLQAASKDEVKLLNQLALGATENEDK